MNHSYRAKKFFTESELLLKIAKLIKHPNFQVSLNSAKFLKEVITTKNLFFITQIVQHSVFNSIIEV